MSSWGLLLFGPFATGISPQSLSLLSGGGPKYCVMENRLELFDKTCNTLIDAWERGELKHNDCMACAVGNICGSLEWRYRFLTVGGEKQRFDYDSSFGRTASFYQLQIADSVISKTGYIKEELARIEYAFENSIAHDYIRLRETSEGQYIGLCAVMEVLWEIHGIQDKSLSALNNVAEAKGVTVNA